MTTANFIIHILYLVALISIVLSLRSIDRKL
jgi:hypothetical protein